MKNPPGPVLLRSFWMGGYEGADHVNARGEALDMVRATGHLDRLEEDYRRAARLGLRTLRESIGWRLSEAAGGALDLSRAVHMAKRARGAGIQPLWTLMHYGLPADLSLFDDALIERFARFAGAVARALRPLSEAPRFYTPINEISFLAWAASTGGFLLPTEGAPACGPEPGRESDSELSGYQIKRRLVRAALAGMAAMREADPEARFLHVEPLVHVAAPQDRPELLPLAQQISDYQWQTLDLLGGRLEPALGGHEAALDWLGFNHYHSSQWEAQSERRLAWHLRDARRQPLSALLQQAWQRYGRPLLVAETGHVGMGRAAWLHEMAGEALQARALGLPLQGVCLYPLLDRPDWYEPGRWHRCGLWQTGAEPARPAPLCADSRVPVQAYARALQAWQCLPAAPTAPRRRLLVLLPGRWESLDASLQRLLRQLAGEAQHGRGRPRAGDGFSVLAAEPPRPHGGPARHQRHRLGPALELLMLHDPAATEDPAVPWQDLTLLRTALGPPPAGGTLTWLMRWPLTGTLDRAALPGDALALQTDGRAPPPGCQVLPGEPDLLLCEGPGQQAAWAAALSPGRTPVLRLPLCWPGRSWRPPPEASYEAREVQALLGAGAGPRLLVFARAQQALDLAWLAALAALRPQWQLFVLGRHAPPADAGPGRWPASCHGLGELAPELLPALLAACDAGLVLAPPDEAGALLWPELLDLGACTGLPVVSTPLASLSALPARAGWHRVPDVATLVQTLDRLLCQPRPRPTRRAQAREARQQRRLLGQLVQAFAGLLDRRDAGPPPLQDAREPADEEARTPDSSGPAPLMAASTPVR